MEQVETIGDAWMGVTNLVEDQVNETYIVQLLIVNFTDIECFLNNHSLLTMQQG